MTVIFSPAMAASIRVLAARGALVLLILGVGAGSFFVWWPTCLVTPYYEVTVTAITFPEPGRFRIEYEDRLVYGWGAYWQYNRPNGRTSSGDFWSFQDKPFLRWPRTSKENEHEYVATLEEGPPGTLADEATLRRRILIKPGTYRIHPGEKLVFYRGEQRDGYLLEGVVEMSPDVQSQTPLEYKPE